MNVAAAISECSYNFGKLVTQMGFGPSRSCPGISLLSGPSVRDKLT